MCVCERKRESKRACQRAQTPPPILRSPYIMPQTKRKIKIGSTSIIKQIYVCAYLSIYLYVDIYIDTNIHGLPIGDSVVKNPPPMHETQEMSILSLGQGRYPGEANGNPL